MLKCTQTRAHTHTHASVSNSVSGLLASLLIQYHDCYLIPATDPPHADCILRLTSPDDEARRGGGSKSPPFGRSYSPQTFHRAEVTDALYCRGAPFTVCGFLGRLLVSGDVCWKPHTRPDLVAARACNVIATNHRGAWPFAV